MGFVGQKCPRVIRGPQLLRKKAKRFDSGDAILSRKRVYIQQKGRPTQTQEDKRGHLTSRRSLK